MKYDPMSRRFFLRGIGGGALAIPFLPSLVPSAARAQTARPPMRFAMGMSMFGRDYNQWYPKLDPAQLQTSDGVLYAKLTDVPGPISYILGPEFDPVRKKMSVLRGLDDVNNVWMHNSTIPTSGSSAGWGTGYSIDCVLEESSRFYSSPPAIGALRINPQMAEGPGMWADQSSFSRSSKTRPNEWKQSEWNPTSVYNKYFNAQVVQKAADTNARIRSVTSAVNDNFREVIKGRRIGGEDRKRLDDYMSLMAQIDAKLARGTVNCGRATAPAAGLRTAEALHSAMIDMEVAALACGMTKIVMHYTLMWVSDPGGAGIDYHAHSHDNRPRAPGRTDLSMQAVFNNFMMKPVAELLTKLDAIIESDGSTLLDNTFFIFGNEDGMGNHTHVDLPVLVAGGQGKLRTGYFIDYRPRPLQNGFQSNYQLGRPYNNLLATAFKALGFSEAEYQKGTGPGVGKTNPFPAFASHYAPFLGPRLSDPLPFLYTG